jgi:hypothetical protein
MDKLGGFMGRGQFDNKIALRFNAFGLQQPSLEH